MHVTPALRLALSEGTLGEMTASALFWIDSIASSSYNGIFARAGTIMGSNYYLNLDK